jgi:hypothetical protein
MSTKEVPIEVARKCATAEATYDRVLGGYTCNACGRHFQRGRILSHANAAKRRVEHADVVVRTVPRWRP